MSGKTFPDDKSSPIFTEAMIELIKGFKHYIQEINKVSEQGDLIILCHLFTAVFINSARDYIEFYRTEKNDPPSQGVKCYKQLVDIVSKGIMSDVVMNVFNFPPEEWEKFTVKA